MDVLMVRKLVDRLAFILNELGIAPDEYEEGQVVFGFRFNWEADCFEIRNDFGKAVGGVTYYPLNKSWEDWIAS